MTVNIHNSIIYRLRGGGRGFIFSPKHFLDLGSRDAVDKALSRLTKQGYINRISRGVYYYPKISPALGVLTPSITEIANVLADKHKTQLQITGAEAVNILGLSNQVPARSVFFTDGQTKNIKVGKKTIELRHASPKKMATAGKASGIVFQALSYIGKENIDETVIDKIKNKLSDSDKKTLKKDVDFCPDWMRPLVTKIVS
jgi:predicted transcriptional regulator of viral defense system